VQSIAKTILKPVQSSAIGSKTAHHRVEKITCQNPCRQLHVNKAGREVAQDMLKANAMAVNTKQAVKFV